MLPSHTQMGTVLLEETQNLRTANALNQPSLERSTRTDRTKVERSGLARRGWTRVVDFSSGTKMADPEEQEEEQELQLVDRNLRRDLPQVFRT